MCTAVSYETGEPDCRAGWDAAIKQLTATQTVESECLLAMEKRKRQQPVTEGPPGRPEVRTSVDEIGSPPKIEWSLYTVKKTLLDTT